MRTTILAVAVFQLCSAIIDLTDVAWNLRSANKTISVLAHLPSDVFTDLERNKIIKDPLYGNNFMEQKWIGLTNWVYTRTFDIPQSDLDMKNFTLVIKGLDGPSKVSINGIHLLTSTNQFKHYAVNLNLSILKNNNNITIEFFSTVKYSEFLAEHYKHTHNHVLPPECPPTIVHGECNINQIRKAQYSFGWDWGPAVPTVGIWKPIFILDVTVATITDVTFTTSYSGEYDIWSVDILVDILHYDNVDAEFRFSIPEIKLERSLSRCFAKGDKTITRFKHLLEVDGRKISRWWPNGMGKPTLYTLVVTLLNTGQKKEQHIGFRTVELVQDYVDAKKPKFGKNFYFKVNDIPVFLKGSNWIPPSMFHTYMVTKTRTHFLLASAAEVGINSLRVWGGGVYEDDFFYRSCDKLGIMIWQDLMFACALYPDSEKFLENVEEEMRQQVHRIKKHPSVIVWAGNNENELAIRTHWWPTENFTENEQVIGYKALYKTALKVTREEDQERPFVASSPSNGEESIKAGGIAKNPGDQRYGDIHFYNEFVNLWEDSVYPIPRCASEFGVQSYAFKTTFDRAMNESEYHYTSPTMVYRQHHQGGLATNLVMVFSHLPIPEACPSKSFNDVYYCPLMQTSDFMSRFTYYSQIHQAVAYKTQVLHYRGYRNRTVNGLGNTMCAMYWQLTDVWAAPTWSSIDYYSRWKMVHYEARRFFAEVAVHAVPVLGDLEIRIMNDRLQDLQNVTVRVTMYAWKGGLTPVYTNDEPPVDVTALSVYTKHIGLNFRKKMMTISPSAAQEYLIETSLIDAEGNPIGYPDHLVPDFLFEVGFEDLGDVKIVGMQVIDKRTFKLTISTDRLSLFTWLETPKHFVGWFSDNGFAMTTGTKEVTFHDYFSAYPVTWLKPAQGGIHHRERIRAREVAGQRLIDGAWEQYIEYLAQAIKAQRDGRNVNTYPSIRYELDPKMDLNADLVSLYNLMASEGGERWLEELLNMHYVEEVETPKRPSRPRRPTRPSKHVRPTRRPRPAGDAKPAHVARPENPTNPSTDVNNVFTSLLSYQVKADRQIEQTTERMVKDIVKLIAAKDKYMGILNNPEKEDLTHMVQSAFRLPTQPLLRKLLAQRLTEVSNTYQNRAKQLLGPRAAAQLVDLFRNIRDSSINHTLSMDHKEQLESKFLDMVLHQDNDVIAKQTKELIGLLERPIQSDMLYKPTTKVTTMSAATTTTKTTPTTPTTTTPVKTTTTVGTTASVTSTTAATRRSTSATITQRPSSTVSSVPLTLRVKSANNDEPMDEPSSATAEENKLKSAETETPNDAHEAPKVDANTPQAIELNIESEEAGKETGK